MLKYFIDESIKKLVQMIFGLEIFDFPILNSLRKLAYKAVFKMGNKLIIEKNVKIYRVHQMKEGNIKIGSGVLLGKNVEIDSSGQVEIEDDVWFSEGSQVHSHYHVLDEDRTKRVKDKIIPVSLTFKEGCWIGARAIILPSVGVIGKHAVVGAGSVVTKPVEDYTVVAGNPAKVIKRLDYKEKRN
ncbi:MAG: acyltransferase [Clostridium sp.]|uniref:acyltransferase n=1 Tax=Clostridium sp. TaxID=1506 RepID=UPI0025BB3E29|nr:acyltransferase [Clostridium sp.]MCF0147285.1 acyltransferase [Clostridium sp.]